MKKSLIAALVAVPLLSLSSMSFAAEPALSEPLVLTASQMDGVTAGALRLGFDFSGLSQWNFSPVTVVQINALNFGNGGNLTDIFSANLGLSFH